MGYELAAPHLMPAEASNVLRRALRAGEISGPDAALATRDLVALDVEIFPFEPFASRVWQLRDNLTAYDAWYVAVAEALGCALLTLDERLSRAPGITCAVLHPAGCSPPVLGALRVGMRPSARQE